MLDCSCSSPAFFAAPPPRRHFETPAPRAWSAFDLPPSARRLNRHVRANHPFISVDNREVRFHPMTHISKSVSTSHAPRVITLGRAIHRPTSSSSHHHNPMTRRPSARARHHLVNICGSHLTPYLPGVVLGDHTVVARVRVHEVPCSHCVSRVAAARSLTSLVTHASAPGS